MHSDFYSSTIKNKKIKTQAHEKVQVNAHRENAHL